MLSGRATTYFLKTFSKQYKREHESIKYEPCPSYVVYNLPNGDAYTNNVMFNKKWK